MEWLTPLAALLGLLVTVPFARWLAKRQGIALENTAVVRDTAETEETVPADRLAKFAAGLEGLEPRVRNLEQMVPTVLNIQSMLEQHTLLLGHQASSIRDVEQGLQSVLLQSVLESVEALPDRLSAGIAQQLSPRVYSFRATTGRHVIVEGGNEIQGVSDAEISIAQALQALQTTQAHAAQVLREATTWISRRGRLGPKSLEQEQSEPETEQEERIKVKGS